MTSRKAKPVSKSATVVVGYDAGYGVIKAVTEGQSVSFPSVAAHPHQIDFAADEISAKYPGEQLTDSEGEWWVGNFAIKQTPINEQIKLQGRTNNEDEIGMAFRKRMLYAALAKLFPDRSGDVIHVLLSTGLPVAHMKDSALMKSTFIGQHKISTNNANFIANIVDCRVMPQPYGTIYSQTMLPNGQLNEYHIYKKTAVFDVGNYTVDCAVDDEGEFVDPESDSAKVGVYTAQERLRKILEGYYRDDISLDMIDQVLRTGYLRAFNEVKDYREEANEALKPLRDGTLGLMNRLWKTGLTIDVIFGAGGGATLVEKEAKRAYPHVKVVDNPQIANSIGYYNYGMSIVNER